MSDIDEQTIDQILVGWKDPLAALRDKPWITISGAGDLVRDYYAPEMRLSIECHLAERYLRAHLLTREEETGITLILRYDTRQQLTAMLETFTRHQDRVSPTTFKVLVREVAVHSSSALVETEQGVQPLLP